MMLRYYLLALGCVAVCQAARLIQAQPESTKKQTDFCSPECLDFETICETGDYEARKYMDAKWVSTTVTDVTTIKAGMRGFRRLSKYLDEENDAGVKIPMTQPVLMQVPTEKITRSSERRYTVSVLLPRVYWENPPKPTNTAVFLENTPEMVVYVKSYSGWASDSNTQSNYLDLVGKLTENNETFRDLFYFSVQYDAPFQTTNRHNEIWVLGPSITDDMYPRDFIFLRGAPASRNPAPTCGKETGRRGYLRMSGYTRKYLGNSLPQCGDQEEFCLRDGVCRCTTPAHISRSAMADFKSSMSYPVSHKECPEYQVIERYDSGIERRRYTGIKMVSLNSGSEFCDVTTARRAGFFFLSNYMNAKNTSPAYLNYRCWLSSGTNGYKEKLDMTTPVLLDVKMKEISDRIEPACDKSSGVSLYIPRDRQQDTPEPELQTKPWHRELPPASREQEVFLQTVDLDVYVKCFNGYSVKDNIIQTYRDMREWLLAEEKCYKPGVVHVASYSDPGMLFSRHNEPKTKPKATPPYILPVGNITDMPAECQIQECPKYKTVKRHENFVQRSVINATMVCTKTVSCSYEAAAMKNFMPLSEYISGQNSAGIKVKMTAPVLTKMVKVGDGDSCEREYTTCFYLPKEHQTNPPKPKNDEVFIDDEPAFDVWVTAFSGWATDDKVDKLMDTFRLQLVNNNALYTQYYFIASYDVPWKTTRYNELWNLKAGRRYKPKHESEESVEQTTETSREISRDSMKCEDGECPEYQSIKKFNNFEERKMPGTWWVCKKSRDCSMTPISSFWSLMNYISGSNHRSVTINMTTPVLQSVTMNPIDLGQKWCDKETVMCFWLPKELQNDPPRPTENGVYLSQSREGVAYVMTYGDVEETEEDFSRRALKFMRILDGAGLSFEHGRLKAVTYDGPQVPTNRRLKEIWLMEGEANLKEEFSEEVLDPVEEKCTWMKCPEYREVGQHDGFVERRIEPGTWVCKNTRRCSLIETDSAYWSLYDYFAGKNSKNTRITMVSPVVHAMNPADLGRDSCDKLSKLCLWLPSEHQKDPPQPNGEGSRGPKAYVLTYSGVRADGEEELAVRVRNFMNILDEAGIEYKPEYVKTVSYDGPNIPVRKRVHEIWLIKLEASDASSREILDPVSEKCKRVECPAYKTIREHEGFEERRVKPGTWVCKKSIGCSPTQTTGAFMSLFHYIFGSNSKNVKIDMTAPVLRMMNPDDIDRDGCDKEVKTCFWLPEKHQKDPPQPTEDGVFLYRSRGPVAYVLTYSGGIRGKDEEFGQRAKEFMGKLDWAGLKYKQEYVKFVGYDGPDVPHSKRVNEIWLIKSDNAEDYRGKVVTTMEDRCRVMDCPNYWSIKKYDGFEERRIMPGTWICKNVSSCSLGDAITKFSWTLVGYVSGGNSKNAEIKQTTTLVIWTHPSTLSTEGCNKDYTACLWLPKEHQEDPPKSPSYGYSAMFLYHSRGPVVYAMPYNVTSRGGRSETFTQRATEFMDRLDAAGIEYKPEYVKAAVFGGGPSHQVIHEVWLVKPEK
ncbi:hypothetical protein Bbelb_043990 [Branchiostoma belcheri]|nr:hypothetical protein Bbelb_043990 [Branchiostoma belcheri]